MFNFCDEKFKHKILQELNMKSRGSIEYRIDMETTAYFKEMCVLAFSKSKVSVFGDNVWKKSFPVIITMQEISITKRMPQIYIVLAWST